jgi:predicted MFS family arabinose efflux permease
MNKKRLLAVLAGVIVARLAFAYQVQTVAALTPYFVQMGVGYTALGSLIGAYLLPGAFVALPLGLLGRRFGEHRLLLIGAVLMTFGNAIPMLSPDIAILAAGRVVAGIGAVALSVMFGKVLAELFQASRFLLASGMAVAAFPLGVGMSQVINPALARALSWQFAFLAGAALAGVSVLLLMAGFRGRARDTVAGRFGWPSGRESGLMIVGGLVWTVYNAGYYGFMSYVPALLLSRGVSDAETGWVMTLATFGSVPAILAGGAIVARVGVMPVFVLGAVTLSGSLVGIALSSHSMIWGLLFGTIGALHPGIVIAAGTLSARPQNRAVGMGMFYTTYYIGGAAFPALCGRVADHFGTPAAALIAASAISVLTIPLFLWHQWLFDPKRGPCATAPAT